MGQFSFDDSQYRQFMSQYEDIIRQYDEIVRQHREKIVQYAPKPALELDLSLLEPKNKCTVRDFEWIDNLIDSLEGEKCVSV